MNNEDLLSGFYAVCNFCKEGKFQSKEIQENILNEFDMKHATHEVEIITGPKFLSEKLSDGFIDINRLDLQPIGTSIGHVEKKDIIESFRSNRNSRMKYLQQTMKQDAYKIQSYFPKLPPVIYSVIEIPKYEQQIFKKEDWLTPQPIKD